MNAVAALIAALLPRGRLAGLLLLGLAASSAGGAEPLATDVNVVTGLDLSESVSGADLRLQLAGMAQALRAPAFLAAVGRGRQGRIGFAVFAWYHGQFPEVAPWRVIASTADAEAAARDLEAFATIDVTAAALARERFYAGRLTGLARAIDHARDLIGSAPFRSGRSVVNIIGNGADNVGGDVAAARGRLVADGATVNGVVIGDDHALLAYYLREVSGGQGAFVMAATEPAEIEEVLMRKFLRDLIAARSPDPRTFR